MKVYLVPVGADQLELYCEVADADDDPAETDGEKPGFFTRLRLRVSAMLKEAERHRHDDSHQSPPTGWAGRARQWVTRWVAESMAEQRLLWQLRKQSSACLVHPADVPGPSALARLRGQLQKDVQKHRFWLVLDGLFFAGSAVLVILPGPNVLAYYLGFRLVGHFFSLKGARRGLDGIVWSSEPSTELTELRTAIHLDPEQRLRRIHEVAQRLSLEHLASFVERTAA